MERGGANGARDARAGCGGGGWRASGERRTIELANGGSRATDLSHRGFCPLTLLCGLIKTTSQMEEHGASLVTLMHQVGMQLQAQTDGMLLRQRVFVVCSNSVAVEYCPDPKATKRRPKRKGTGRV